MATYQISGAGVIRSDGACIPPDPENRDWAAYLAWCEQGGVADPESPEAPVDETLALLQASARAKISAKAELTPEETSAMFGDVTPQP